MGPRSGLGASILADDALGDENAGIDPNQFADLKESAFIPFMQGLHSSWRRRGVGR
jgi:hypothetical protein